MQKTCDKKSSSVLNGSKVEREGWPEKGQEEILEGDSNILYLDQAVILQVYTLRHAL